MSNRMNWLRRAGIAAVVLIPLAFAGLFVGALGQGEKATDNPWDVGTLEWTIPSPPPHHNYDEIPVVLHGPHEFNNPAVHGRDWLAQDEPIEEPASPAALGAAS